MDTPLEESNLAYIGSDEDKAVREAAAKMEMHWEGAGQKEGVEIWRVENMRDKDDNPAFGIKPWPKSQYGDFYKGPQLQRCAVYMVRITALMNTKL
jgi:gelsolin